MIKNYLHACKGTCSRTISISYDDETNLITDLEIVGGCNGNLNGLSKILVGLNINEVHDKLKGTKCGPRETSCPDQIALAIEALTCL